MPVKNLVILTAVIILGGCGFQPLHGSAFSEQNGSSLGFENIKISNIPNQEGQYLRNALIDRFYKTSDGRAFEFILSVVPIKETKRDLDITVESDTTREQLRLDTSIELVDASSGEVVLSRNLYALSSFNVLGNEFATRVSERSSRENALDDLARQIELQIALYMKR